MMNDKSTICPKGICSLLVNNLPGSNILNCLKCINKTEKQKKKTYFFKGRGRQNKYIKSNKNDNFQNRKLITIANYYKNILRY
jgi:hypothetical protein